MFFSLAHFHHYFELKHAGHSEISAVLSCSKKAGFNLLTFILLSYLVSLATYVVFYSIFKFQVSKHFTRTYLASMLQ